MTTDEKHDAFMKLVSPEKSKLLEMLDWEVKNRFWLRKSSDIAILILDKLDELNITKTELALKLQVSPAYVSKLVKGSENFTLETIVKLEKALNINILTNLKEPPPQKWIMCGTFTQSSQVGAWTTFEEIL